MTLQKPQDGGNVLPSLCQEDTGLEEEKEIVDPHPSLLISLFLSCSFAGGTWDWEYLGFASPEVIKQASMMFLLFGPAYVNWHSSKM